MKIKVLISLFIILALCITLSSSRYNDDNDREDRYNGRKHHYDDDDTIEVVVKVKIPNKHNHHNHHHNYIELDDIQDEKCNRCKYYDNTKLQQQKIQQQKEEEEYYQDQEEDQEQDENNTDQDKLEKNHHFNRYHRRDICGCFIGYYGKECRKRELNYQKMFIDWSNQFNKTYSADSFYKVYENFKDSSRFVQEYNKNNETTMELGLTQFSDMTHEEFQHTYLSVLDTSELDESLWNQTETETPIPTETPTPTPTPTTGPCSAKIEQTIETSWVSGQTDDYIQVKVTITNDGALLINGFNFYLQVQQIWEVSTIGENKYGLPSWISSIPIGESIRFGYIMKSSVLVDLQQVNYICYHSNQTETPTNKPGLLKSLGRPASIDWRVWGYGKNVKNQGGCGSCYSFSAIGTLESHYKRKYGIDEEFSEQQIRILVVNRAKDYPYEATVKGCRARNEKYSSILSFAMIKRHDEEDLADVVATIGPVAVAYDASTREFQYYNGGIYYSANCDKYRTTHAVVVLGYGTENGIDYWIIKNSWGPEWGEKGYFRMRRNIGDKCGIATSSSYPVVA
ncbi:hypothetical protein DICPUDRAFT_74639 [Dictyostelium purpureum]|uniref:Papain family cysteine protease n=1 Tax=Dictyostelium purpureum TaxID=5786 RepID=F0Z8B9_DICPU|nr:uncharacterized protein DICPUDRAFT_74639 [Dictyostelium purpureum]EGC39810.1 hypothetical protein DICPUDRAFT_74639 [Dictyostelium purpureum]|eukprot:XP_003283677.1 hypothetical protein DICPUDRAFT_74639 [Dictyostelium purpureum]